jgi:hypothetical protein
MRTIMMSLVLAAMSGCATVGKVGANTTNYRVWWKDCGVSRDLPSNIEVFHGQTPSPNTALATAEQLPNPRSNVKGVLRVIIHHPECNGQGVEVADPEHCQASLMMDGRSQPVAARLTVETWP